MGSSCRQSTTIIGWLSRPPTACLTSHPRRAAATGGMTTSTLIYSAHSVGLRRSGVSASSPIRSPTSQYFKSQTTSDLQRPGRTTAGSSETAPRCGSGRFPVMVTSSCSLLDGGWQTSRAAAGERDLTLIGAHTDPGMSGSPILDKRGRAVSIVSQGTMHGEQDSLQQPGQPMLVNSLPLWLLAAITLSSVFVNLPRVLSGAETGVSTSAGTR